MSQERPHKFNGRNLQTQVINPDDTSVVTTYDGAQNKVTATDEIGQVTTFVYDDANRLTSSTNFANETTRFEYDLNNNKTNTIQPLGNSLGNVFDALNRVTQITDGENNVTRYTYDKNDNQVSHTDANNNIVSYEYDRLDRRTRHSQPNGLVTTSTYDEEGNMIGRVDQNGQTFTYEYDALDRQTKQVFPPVQSPYMQIQNIVTAYDPNNNPINITENKLNTLLGQPQIDICTMAYDLLDRKTQEDQRGHLISYTYDDNGNRLSVASEGGSTDYTYDSRNRLTTAATGNGVSTYVYTGDSKQERVTYANGTVTSYVYDNADRITSAINERIGQSSNELISSFVYEYDDNSNRISQLETQNGFVLQKVQTSTYGYDNTNRLTDYQITDQDSGDVQAFSYGYDNNYNRISEVETKTTGGVTATVKNQTSSFDANNRLSNITDNLDTEQKQIDYIYDNNGNTLSKTDNTKSTPEFTNFEYDSRNQLAVVIRGPPGARENLGYHDYNFKSLRVRHVNSERGDIDYIYDQESILEERLLGTNTLMAHYRYSDRLISLNTSTDEQYYHYSALSTTANLTNKDGQIQASYRTDVWGHITNKEGSSPNRQVFTGQEHDEKTGLIYFGARFYDPDTARFINQDSYLGESSMPPSLHRYLYAYGNPTVFVDLDGYKSTTTILDEAAMEAASNGENLKLAGLVTAQAFYKISDTITFGWISKHDEARDLRDSGQISTSEYHSRWQKQAVKSGTLFAATAVTGGAAGVAAKGLGTTARFGAAGAGSGLGFQATNDIWNGELSSAGDYAKSVGFGAVGGVAVRGGLAFKNKVGNTSVTSAFNTVKTKIQTQQQKLGKSLTAETKPSSNGNRAPDVSSATSKVADEVASIRSMGSTSKRSTNLNKKISKKGGLSQPRTRESDFALPRSTSRSEWKIGQSKRRMGNRRARGVDRFWKAEKNRLLSGGQGTRNWSADQKQAILNGKVPKFNGESLQGHHMKNVKNHPKLSDDPANIYPATEFEHFKRWHGGNWKNSTNGKPNNPMIPEEF